MEGSEGSQWSHGWHDFESPCSSHDISSSWEVRCSRRGLPRRPRVESHGPFCLLLDLWPLAGLVSSCWASWFFYAKIYQSGKILGFVFSNNTMTVLLWGASEKISAKELNYVSLCQRKVVSLPASSPIFRAYQQESMKSGMCECQRVVQEVYSSTYICMVIGTMGSVCMSDSLNQSLVHRDLWFAVQFEKF